MNWVKIFQTEAEAFDRIKDDTPQLLIIGDKRICLVRHRDFFKAIQDSCTHNGESLSKGHVNFLGEIICPWHNYCFNISNGREIQNRSSDLQTFPVRADDTGFFIGI
jgi:nitrite reductase/ring-hydroxylating ferredoxin subunit